MRPIIAKVMLLVLVLFLQWTFLPLVYNPWPHGELLDVRYRQHERLAAFWEFKRNPSPSAEATFHLEMERMHRYLSWVVTATVVVVGTADWIVIHFILDRERLKKA